MNVKIRDQNQELGKYQIRSMSQRNEIFSDLENVSQKVDIKVVNTSELLTISLAASNFQLVQPARNLIRSDQIVDSYSLLAVVEIKISITTDFEARN
jgi:hypothetical protein